jgi:hypothetical protein
MALIYSSIVMEALGPEFDDYNYLPAQGTRGGILLAWKSRDVSITAPLFTMNAITAKVTVGTNTPWWILVVYGPQEDEDKISFLQELRDARADCQGPWMLCGDFNLIYRAEDKNNGNLHRRMMWKFRHLLNDLLLKEVYPGAHRAAWWCGRLVAPLRFVFWLRQSSVKIGPLRLFLGIFLKVEFLHKNRTPGQFC